MPAFDPSNPPGDCPFCTIASSFPPYDPRHPPSASPPTPPTTTNSPVSPSISLPPSPSPPSSSSSSSITLPPPSPSGSRSGLLEEVNLDPDLTSPPSYVVLSTELVMAFLDIMPLSPGHLLVTTRRHRGKISDVEGDEAGEMGRWLPVLSRVLAAVGGVWDWNIVQNNGAAAAQVVGHVHFHIIPRPALTDELRNKSFTMFGRGQRSDLDDEEARELVVKLRVELARELDRIGKGKL